MCELDSDPTNVTFKWFFNDLKTEIKTFTTINGTTSLATFIPASSHSSIEGSLTSSSSSSPSQSSSRGTFGRMICLGENSIGRQRDPCIFNIIPASKTFLT
jgi:hypothetical protein